MATLKCLACGQDNSAGEEACRSCSSSLNLRLCGACEAVNAAAAERCHSCGAEFRQESALRQEAAPATAVEDSFSVVEAMPAELSLPAIRRPVDTLTVHSGRRRASVLWTVVFAITAGGAYAYYELPGVPVAKGLIASAIAPKSAPAPVLAPPSAPSVAPGPGFIRPVETIPAPKLAESPPKTAQVVHAKPPAEPKRAASTVTHTPAGPAPAVASTASAAIAPAPNITQPTVAASAAPRRARVTHTKSPAPGEAPAVTASTAVLSQPRIEQVKEQSACPPGVAALGLCISK